MDRRVGVDVARADGDGDDDVERDGQGARYERQMYGPGMEEGQTVADPGRERRKKRRRGRAGVAEEEEEGRPRKRWRRNGRDTEGTCYALRDMAEARGIHNFVKTKMLRSCLGGVAFFLVSRNVQARLSLRPSSSCLSLSLRHPPRRFFPLPPSAPPRFSLLPPLPTSCWCPPCPSYLRASSLSRFSGNAPRNEKRFVKNVSASS